MPNLKLDLLNKLRNSKYYVELELARLAQEPNMNYKEKIKLMSDKLKKIAVINAQVSLIEQQYFVEPEPVTKPEDVKQPPVNTGVPQTRPHDGQTHGE
jgi:hypothetical protein